MASIQARHHPSCALGDGSWRFKKLGTKGCSCPRGRGPIFPRPLPRRRPAEVRGSRAEPRLARRACRRREDQLDEARELAKLDGRRPERKDATFRDWSTEWFGRLTCKATTRSSYVSTLEYANAAFGDRVVRVLDLADVRAFLDKIRAGLKPPAEGEEEHERKVSDSTLAKHLRVLGACLEGAVIEGYGAENPVKRLPKTARPRAAKSVPSYFTDAELAKLWTVMPADLPVGVFLYLCKTAVATGMRQGELLALRLLA